MSIVRAGQKSLVHSESMSGAAGKGLVAAGAGGISLWLLAGLIPFVGMFGLSIVLLVVGAMLWE